jgi:hypothetical protein
MPGDNVPEREDAIPGAALVIPLTLGQVDPWHSVSARIDDGSSLDAKLYQVIVNVPLSGQGSDNKWLPASGIWMAMPANARDRSSAPSGTWVALVHLPSDGHGAILHLGKRDYTLNWLPTPSLLPAADGPVAEPLLDPWRPAAGESVISDQSLLARAQSEATSPLTRWRYKLLVSGLRREADAPDALAFKDPVIEAIARQNEDRWRIALYWLWSADPELAARLKRRLSAVLDFGNHTLAPAWSVDHRSLDRLLADLLNSAITPQRRGELAETWLAQQPGGAAWVIDDGGLLDDQRKAIIPTVGIANLQDRRTLAWTTSRGATATPEPIGLDSMGCIKLLVAPCPVEGSPDDPPPTNSISAHVGRWSSELPCLNRRLPVSPPGFAIGPLLRDYTMADWEAAAVGAAPIPARAEWATAAMLHRPAPDPGAPPSAAESRRWEILVECRVSPEISDISSLQRESVRLFFGPSARPVSILRVDLTGLVTNEQPPDPMAPPEMESPPAHVDIKRTIDRWSFRLTLPPGAVESDGLLRIGCVRTDALERRSAWPRPMLPWQSEPGRAALDTRAWTAGAGQ